MVTSGSQSRTTAERQRLIAVRVSTVSVMTLPVAMLVLCASVVFASAESNDGLHELLSGERILLATVEETSSADVRVNTGDLQPRYLPLNVRKDKGLPDLKPGDRVAITVNDQNLIVDVHLLGGIDHHRIIRGVLAQPLMTGHEQAVIQTEDGKEESHVVRPLARSKVASVPVRAHVIFLLDERHGIADVTYESAEAVKEAQQLRQKKSSLKTSFKRVTGVILQTLGHNTISIQTHEGHVHSLEVRPLVLDKLTTLPKGNLVVLIVDDENKVTDVSNYDLDHQR
ncbi:MAG: hypothetical protein NPIRA03_15180 [Nitrospirales bacterium]|nr:MAG: hypothetical protein NPIRA03_15180 [Nitrospirales bacterium]